MASREWMITKVVLLLVSIITLVSICVGAANVIVNLQGHVSSVDRDVQNHVIADEKKWDKNSDELKDIRVTINDVEGIQTSIRIAQSETTANYAHILREIEKLNIKLDSFEVR